MVPVRCRQPLSGEVNKVVVYEDLVVPCGAGKQPRVLGHMLDDKLDDRSPQLADLNACNRTQMHRGVAACGAAHEKISDKRKVALSGLDRRLQRKKRRYGCESGTGDHEGP